MTLMRPIASIFKKVTDVIKIEDTVKKVHDRIKIQKISKGEEKLYSTVIDIKFYT